MITNVSIQEFLHDIKHVEAKLHNFTLYVFCHFRDGRARGEYFPVDRGPELNGKEGRGSGERRHTFPPA
jgi:hypothetical protein